LAESGRLSTDEELIARTLAGDDEAFATLVSRHTDLVYTIALRVVGDEDEADDVAQETFVRAYRALGRFRGDSKFSSWLYRIAVNRGLTHLKRRKRRAVTVDFVAEPYVEAQAAMADTSTDPERFVLDQEFRLRVRDAVKTLPPRYRAVVTLFYLEERSYREVADVLGIPMGTLKTHLHRARALLKNVLTNDRND
jgi:RNA polymerase sigma-70 factor (ECF subfamily)